MEGIKCFIECLIPETVCNLRCSYCYVIQREGDTGIIPELKYPIDTIKRSLTKERFGGTCYFSICGVGETLAPTYTLEIVKALLENGHYVNVTTNGTLTKCFESLKGRDGALLERLHFAFSFHYLELMRLNRIESFFENNKLAKSLGCSFVVQINLCDEYLPHLDEIKRLCIEHVGAWPQVAATRKELDLHSKVLLHTELSDGEYLLHGREFDSSLFDFTMKNFHVKRREFCYAGAWSFQLNLLTGVLKPCYHTLRAQRIYDNPEQPIKKIPVGCTCGSLFCMNSSHFMSLGVIPGLETPTYAELRDRPEANWYTPLMRQFLSGKLSMRNEELAGRAKALATVLGHIDNCAHAMRRIGGKALKRIGFRN